jgi:hypothetical protein
MSPGLTLATGARSLTFWAKGETGGEVVSFTTGGIQGMTEPYKDTFNAGTGNVTLTTTWTQYTIDLTKFTTPLGSCAYGPIIGGFFYYARSTPGKTVAFSVDSIVLQ